MRICVYAFSSTALLFRALIDACDKAGDKVEWSVICPQGHFRHRFHKVVPPERLCYLYQGFEPIYRACGKAEIQAALACGEGLTTALMKDKDGYRNLDKDEQLKRGAAIHQRYAAFLDRVKPDAVLFPDLEAVDGFILMNLCHERRIEVLYYADMRFLGRGFFARNPYEQLPVYFGAYDAADRKEARRVIDAFLARRPCSTASSYPSAPPPKPSLYRRLVVSTWLKCHTERLHASEETLWMKIARNAMGIVAPLRRWRFNLLATRFFDKPEAVPDRYVFYALHYTPESSINGLEPYYVDQTRAIDALLLSLPKGTRLVVKEHPAMYGVRPLSFYRQLRRRPGLVLLHPSVDSRRLVEGAAITVTITGTVGLEAYLLGKPCLSFGRNFFAHLNTPAPALRGLRNCLEQMIASFRPPSEEEKEIEVAKLLAVGGNFAIGDPWYNPRMVSKENVEALRTYLWQHLARLGRTNVNRGPAETL